MDQHIDGQFSQLIFWLVNGGQRRCHIACELNIIVAHQRHVLRNVQTGLVQRLISANRHGIVADKYRLRPLRQSQQLLHRAKPAAKLKITGHHVSVGNRQAAARHRSMITFKAQTRRGFIQRAGNTGNARMPLVNQILGRHIAAKQRVILNQIAIAIKGSPVHHDRRYRWIALHNFRRGLMGLRAQQQ